MKRTFTKAISVFLVVAMLLCAAPLNGFVGIDLPSLFGFKADATMHIGFGTLDCEVRSDLLIAAGEGEIPDCASPSDVWWSDSTSDIESAIIGNGITSIGDYVCYGCDNLTTLTISDSVERIGDYAFDGCTQLSEIYYFGTAEEWNNIEIGVGNDALDYVVIYFESAPVISDRCGVSTAWGLDVTTGELVVFGSGMMDYPWENTLVLDWADYALLVESVVIEEGVTNISHYAFDYFDNLTSVTIGSDVTYIDDGAFSGCGKITDVYYAGNEEEWDNLYIADGNEVLESADITFNYDLSANSVASGTCGETVTWKLGNNGILSISGTGAMYYFDRTPWQRYNEKVRYVIVGDGVTSIGGGAFYGCVNLRVAMLPKSIVSIYEYAFSNCTELTDVFYRGSFSQWDSIEISTTGNEALTTNKLICFGRDENIEVPTTLPYEERTTVPVTEEPGTVPTTVPPVIPTTTAPAPTTTQPPVTVPPEIETETTTTKPATTAPVPTTTKPATTAPTTTKPVVETTTKAPSPEETTTVPTPSYDYSGTCGDNLIWTLNKSTGVLNVTGTGAMTNWSYNDNSYDVSTPWYKYSSYIKTVNIASGVTSIGNYAFYSCDSLTSVTISDSVTTIGDFAFAQCDSLTSVAIPDGVTSIGIFAFAQCDSLTSVAIPDSVTIISDYAFHICSSLSNITIPNSVTTIGDEAFYSCDSLTSVTIPDSVTSIGNGAFSDCDSLTSVTIPDSVTTIGSDAFSSCTSLKSVTIGNSVTTIGNYAFCDCDSLTSVTIGNSVTTIGESAFYDCNSLTSITIPDSVTTIGERAFWWCDSLTSITVDENNKNYSSDSYGVLFNKDKTTLIQYLIGNKRTSYTIPGGVTTIADWAFYRCSSLTSVTIPDSVTTIGNSAFYSCDSLTSVAIPDSVTTIGDCAFRYCESLTSVTIPDSVTIIGENAFEYCYSLTSITLPDSVTTIGEYAFYHCDDLTSITVDLNNKKYSSDSYGVLFNKDKTTLIQYPIGNTRTNYAIPDSVTTIDDSAFGVCSNLTSVTIPDSVTIIGNYAFHICGNLTSVTIPDSVTIIGESAFAWCDSLTDVYYTGTKTQWENISIGSYNEPLMNATIHWPDKVVSENIDYYIKYGDNDYRGVTINATIADSSFSQDSAVYNHDLARLCSQFTVVGYTSTDGNGNSKNQVMKNALKKLGFKKPEVNLSEGRTSVNYFIANKPITVNGEEYVLIFAGFIGSYHEQWYSNFDPGTGATHQGFRSAADTMLNKIDEYIKSLNIDKSFTKILLTGHSRGAATSNLVAADLIKSEQYACKENIYTYAFATPNSTTLAERNNAEYKRIFNIVNPEDFVTKAMPTKWGYGRYGTSFVLPSKTNTSSKAYKTYRANMQQYFGVLTNGGKYEPYIEGENPTYLAVTSLTAYVPNVNMFYSLPLLAGVVPVTPYYFFQNTLCHFVSKTASVLDYTLAATLIIETLGYIYSCPAYTHILNYFVLASSFTKEVQISGRFEDAHRAETYCAYMMSMSEQQIQDERKSHLNSVNCPVDIEVIDKETDEVVGRIVNNVIDEEIAAKENSIVMSVDGDSKSFWLPSDGDYEVKLIGNGEGTMDYTVAEIDPDLGETERINFFDVEITEGKEMTGDVPAYDFELDEYTLKTDSGEETPDQKLDAESGEITITTSVEGDGYVTNTLTVKSGDYVTLIAQPFVTAKFVKWVDSSGNTLSTDAEYSFVAKENTSIKAVFTTAEGINIKMPSVATINYGETLVLHLEDVEVPEGYKIEWSIIGDAVTISVSEDGKECRVTSTASGNVTVRATVVDENGEPVLNAEGGEIFTDINIKSNANFWQKIVSFFKNLFRMNRIIY